jgi:predicted acyl esterase
VIIRVLVKALLALALCLAGQQPALAQTGQVAGVAHAEFGHYQPAPQFDGWVSHSFYITLRDGVQLAMRVDRPANRGVSAEGRFPVIWHHSLSISQQRADGTGERATAFRRMHELTRHGYVVVQVARRGNGQSLGAMRGYHDRNEAQDAFEVTQWLGANHALRPKGS